MTYEQCFQVERALARIEETLEEAGASRDDRILGCVRAALVAATVERIRLELRTEATNDFADAFQRTARLIENIKPRVG